MTLYRKELADLLQQRRYLLLMGAVLLVSAITSYLSVQEYHQAQKHASAVTAAHQQILAQTTSPSSLSQLAVRRPNALEIIAPGVSYDLGRIATIRSDEIGDLTGSLYTQEPLFALVRTIDPIYAIQIVLSLVALLLSHGLISQEREQGTLRLLFSHPVSRLTVYLSKGLASLTALVPMLAITLLFPLALGLMSGLNFSSGELVHLVGIGLCSLLYLAICVAIGMACSIWWQSARMSLLGALSIWLLLCLAWPRLGVTIARMVSPTSTEAQVAAETAAFEIDRWRQFEQELIGADRNTDPHASEEQEWASLQLSDSLRRATESDISDFRNRLRENLIRQQESQHRTAMILARLSPSSALTLASSRLAGTDPDLAVRYYDALNLSHEKFRTYYDEVSKTVDDNNRFTISVETRNGVPTVNVDVPRRSDPMDLSNMPAFAPPSGNPQLAGQVALDFVGLIAALSLFGLLGLGRFLRADLR